MGNFWKEIFKNKQTIIIVTGIAFIAISLINFKGFPYLEPRNNINTTCMIFGIVFFVIGLIYDLIEESTNILKTKNYKFKKESNDKYSIVINQGCKHTINIIFGKINNFQEYDENTLVILPANDKFDDKCVDDKKSVLGSFSHSLYPTNNNEFKSKIRDELAKRSENTFNIGSSISLQNIKSDNYSFNIGIIAVTHLKDDGNIVAYSENILIAFKGIHKIMTEERLDKVYIPLIGSGHGGITPELSLFLLLTAIIEGIRKEDGHKLKDLNIIVYKKNNGDKDISAKKVRKIVKFVLNNYN